MAALTCSGVSLYQSVATAGAIKTEREGEEKGGKEEGDKKGERKRELGAYGIRQIAAECGQWHDDEKLRRDQYVGHNLVKPRNSTHPIFSFFFPFCYHFFFPFFHLISFLY